MTRPSAGRRAWLGAEALLLFVAGPTLVVLTGLPRLLFPAIWTLGFVCLLILMREPRFIRGRLWNWRGLVRRWPRIALRFLAGAALLTMALLVIEPQGLLALPRHNPGLWALILLIYPVLSVYPQEAAFRACFLHRYACLFPGRRPLIAASAAAFAFAHVAMSGRRPGKRQAYRCRKQARNAASCG